jgi:hypothetical protein
MTAWETFKAACSPRTLILAAATVALMVSTYIQMHHHTISRTSVCNSVRAFTSDMVAVAMHNPLPASGETDWQQLYSKANHYFSQTPDQELYSAWSNVHAAVQADNLMATINALEPMMTECG